LSYRTTHPVSVDQVLKFKYDPIANSYIGSSPVRPYVTNKMSIEEMFTPVENPTNSQRYIYSWQQPSRSTLTEAERLGIPKGERNLTISERDYPVGTAQ